MAGTLADTLARVLGSAEPPVITGAGRTDAGVHAWGQVVSFDAASEVDLVRLVRSLNSMLAPSIVVRSAALAEPDFDARFSALWRRYRYTVLNTPTPSPFLAATAWHVPQPLAIEEMQLACDPLIGEHDFTSLCRRPKGDLNASMVRRVAEARWSSLDGGLARFEIRANAFCQQMVRSIVGLLVDVGLGKRRAGEVAAVLRARDRAVAATVAPPHGLCLWEVGY